MWLDVLQWLKYRLLQGTTIIPVEGAREGAIDVVPYRTETGGGTNVDRKGREISLVGAGCDTDDNTAEVSTNVTQCGCTE